VIDCAVLVHIPENRNAVALTPQLEPPIVVMGNERVAFAVNAAMCTLAADQRVADPKARSPKSVP
jgi:tRNA threonylcarbamoyladenosine modification (KEOPS) complex Cgi121 subunit